MKSSTLSRCSLHLTYLKPVSVAEMNHAYFKSHMGKPHPSSNHYMAKQEDKEELVTCTHPIPAEKAFPKYLNADEMTNACFEPAKKMMKRDPRNKKQMACCIIYSMSEPLDSRTSRPPAPPSGTNNMVASQTKPG